MTKAEVLQQGTDNSPISLQDIVKNLDVPPTTDLNVWEAMLSTALKYLNELQDEGTVHCICGTLGNVDMWEIV